MLVDEGYLYGVISLPSGVFNPYSGVKTSILLIDRTLAKQKDSILFVKLNNDGYDLGAQRREIKGSEIPDVINIFKSYQVDKDIVNLKNIVVAKKCDISKQEYILVGERYKTETVVSSNWPMVKLGDITEVVSGNGFPKDLQGDKNGEFPFYKVSDMNLAGNESSMFTSNNYVTHQVVSEQNWKLVSSNTVIFPKIGAAIATNKKRMLTTESLFDNNVMGLVCGDQVDKRYLYYILQSINLSQWASESNPPSIRKTTVEQFSIPLPPLSIQKEIVSEIEQYQKIIDGARQVVDNYRPTIKVNPQWEQKSLLSLCELLDSKRIPITSSDRTEGPIPYYGASGIVDYVADYIFDEKLLLVSEDGANLVARVYPIAFSIEGKTWVNNHAHVLKFENYAVQKYVEFYMNQMDISRYVTGAAQPKLSQENMRRIVISIPDSDQCEAIVALLEEEIFIVEQNKRLISIFEKKIQDKLSEVWGE